MLDLLYNIIDYNIMLRTKERNSPVTCDAYNNDHEFVLVVSVYTYIALGE